MKEAVMTCVLSKRWRFLWTDLSEFAFYEMIPTIENIRKLVDFVNRTLVLCNGDLVKTFEVNFMYVNCFASAVNAWIEFAVKYRVKNIALTFSYSYKDKYILPRIMYSHSYLEMLRLRKCIITSRGRFEWGSLKHLYLEKVELRQPVIPKIFSGCPVLCSLYLEACSGFDRLEVNSQSLMTLTVKDKEPFVEISAPYIHCLEISARYEQRFRLKNISSLVEASIDFCIDLDAINYVQKLFVSLQHVKNLNLGRRCIQVLSMMAKKGLLLPIPKQECMRLNIPMSNLKIPLILRLLGSFPDLETLVIKRDYFPYQDGEGRDPYACDLKCDLLHLKSIDIEIFEDSDLDCEPMLKLVQLLLKKAIVLEKMVIKVRFRALSSTRHSRGYIKIAEMLLSYPRSSPKAVVAKCCLVSQDEDEDEDKEEDEDEDKEEDEDEEEEEISSAFSSSNKRVKPMPRDRLSTLSDSLLLHILSLLRMKEAVMTCVLSKRWRFLWTDLSEFTFYEIIHTIENVRKLVDFVNRTLVLCNGDLVKRFEVGFMYVNCFASAVNAWIEFAVKYRVKNIALTLLYSFKDKYILPQIMYSHSSLEMLSLRKCIITPRGRVQWGSLKHLYLEKVELHQPVITEILSGCPVLCSLHLEACSGFDRLEVNSQSLMSLAVKDKESFVEISAPYLVYLKISACFKQRFRLKNISSLVEASIDFCIDLDAINYVQKLFVSLQHVKNLNLGRRCIQVLSMMAKEGLLLPIPKQDCLRLNMPMNNLKIPLILRLLGSFPDLEMLVIKRGYFPYQDGEGRDPYACDLKCDLLHLKSVNIEIFEDSDLGGEPMLKLVQLLLKKAIVLEKMVIKVKFWGLSSTRNSSDYIKIAEMLLSYPRSSPKAVVVLVDDSEVVRLTKKKYLAFLFE